MEVVWKVTVYKCGVGLQEADCAGQSLGSVWKHPSCQSPQQMFLFEEGWNWQKKCKVGEGLAVAEATNVKKLVGKTGRCLPLVVWQEK